MVWIGAILAIGILIIVHESGHYFVARWCNMRVDRFSVGFGPAIWSFTRGETQFQIAPIPFGGFVQINGMLVADEVEPGDERAYPNRPAWQRFLTIFAGPATNYLFAVVLAIGLYAIAGVPTGTAWNQISEVREGFDSQGKLEPGDRILAVGGTPIFWSHPTEEPRRLVDIVQSYNGKPIPITVERDGATVEVTVTAKKDQQLKESLEKDQKQQMEALPWGLGLRLRPDEERVSIGFIGAIGEALYYPIRQTQVIVVTLLEAISGRGDAEFTGPVGIATMVKSTIEVGWLAVIQLLMILNVYLGLFNLFPLPALDGGRLVFLSYEMITRRRANPKIEATVHMVGIMALFLVLILVTYKDIAKLF